MADAHLLPTISVRRALLAWIVALATCVGGAWLFYRQESLAADVPVLVPAAVAIAYLATWAVASPFGRWARDGVVRQSILVGIVLPALPMASAALRTHFWAAAIVAAGLETLLVGLVAAAIRGPDGGYPPIRWFRNWSGLWALTDPEVARVTPIRWKHAIRSWLIVWPPTHLLAIAVVLSTGGSRGSELNLPIAPLVAFIVVSGGLTGTQDRPRARHPGLALIVGVSAAVATALTMCAGLLFVGWGGALAAAELITTGGLVLTVLVTHLPLRVPAAAAGA